jgi:hypothetical protein
MLREATKCQLVDTSRKKNIEAEELWCRVSNDAQLIEHVPIVVAANDRNEKVKHKNYAEHPQTPA